MSRRGNCYDNAPMESFWGSLKNELVHHCRYTTRAEAEASIREYIEIFYNRQRRHSRLGYVAPAVFAKNFGSQPAATLNMSVHYWQDTSGSLGLIYAVINLRCRMRHYDSHSAFIFGGVKI